MPHYFYLPRVQGEPSQQQLDRRLGPLGNSTPQAELAEFDEVGVRTDEGCQTRESDLSARI